MHSIPGRVRFSIPGLKMVDKELLTFEEELIQTLQNLNGVNEISFNTVSGKALLTYDVQRTSEEKLMSHIKFIWDVLATDIINLPENTVMTEQLIHTYKLTLNNLIAERNAKE